MESDRLSAARAGLAKMLERVPDTRACRGRSVLIGGWNRIGKGEVARRLESAHGFKWIPLDGLRRLYGDIADPALRAEALVCVLRDLLQRRPTGVVVEGHDLVLDSSSPRFEDRTPERLSVRAMAALRDHPGAVCILLGDSGSAVADKAVAIRAHGAAGRCWTASHPMWQGDLFEVRVREIRSASARLAALARQHDMDYFDLPVADFRARVAEIAAQIAVIAGRA